MKTDKTRDAMGRPSWSSSFLSDPGAKFLVENEAQVQKREGPQNTKNRLHSCFSSLAEPVLSAQQSRVRPFGRGAADP